MPRASTCGPTMSCATRRRRISPCDSGSRTPRWLPSARCMRDRPAKGWLPRRSMSARLSMRSTTVMKATLRARPTTRRTSTCRCWPTGYTMPRHPALAAHGKAASTTPCMRCARGCRSAQPPPCPRPRAVPAKNSRQPPTALRTTWRHVESSCRQDRCRQWRKWPYRPSPNTCSESEGRLQPISPR